MVNLKNTAEKEVDEKSEDIEEAEEEIEIVELERKIVPELSSDISAMLKIREAINRRRPKFRRQEWFRYKRLGLKWRAPRGVHSKMRRHYKYRPNIVSIGYRSPRLTRGYHPSGFKEVLVYNVKDLEKLNPRIEAARIGSTVGWRKRMAIEDRAKELGIRVLNPKGE
jgi:large subunit ribosomal protein L32e